MQAVTNKEAYASHSTPAGIFGYGPRYDQYRHQLSSIAGEFRSTLDHFHIARDLSSDPTLNQSYIECNPSKRIHANTSDHTLWAMVNHPSRS